MRPEIETIESEVYECPGCGSRYDGDGDGRCDGCGRYLVKLGRERDL